MATEPNPPTPTDLEDPIEGEEPEEFVPLPTETPAPAPAKGPAESTNLTAQFTEEEQKNIVSTVCDDYDGDHKSRAGRMRKYKEYIGLHASVMKAKTMPFQNCANVNLPILTYPVLQVQGRLYDMVWPASGNILYSSPTNMQDMVRAQITEVFANAYIRNKMPEMPQGLDDTLFQMILGGSAFRRTYWNEYEKRICSDWIPIENFVVSHSERSQDPSMRDVERYTMVLPNVSYWDLKMWGARGIYANTDKITPSEPTERKDTEVRQQLNKVDGSEKSRETTVEDQERMVMAQYRKWEMPDKGAYPFDGKLHDVEITVDNDSQQLLKFVIFEEPDPGDLARFRSETQKYDGHMQSMQAYMEQTQAQMQATEIAAQQGIEIPPDALPPPPAPQPPPGLEVDDMGLPVPVEPQRMQKICTFTHYKAFPSDGFYGLGLGDFLAHLTKACNALTNQRIDHGAVRNSQPFFYTRNMRGQRGQINLAPGQGIEVDSPMGALKDGLFFPDMPQPDNSTMPMIKMLMEAGDRLVASSDMMSGQTSGANRTAKEAMILAEQMMMTITVVARRVKEAFRHELLKIWRCFGVFLPEEEMVDIIGDNVDPRNEKISRAMFTPDSHVTPAADPRTKTERIQEAQALFGYISQNPYLMASPSRDPMMRAATEEVLAALGAVRFLKLMPPPPQPPQPPKPAQYFEEDAGFLQNKPHPVTPGDDDVRHLHGHQEFRLSPAGNALSKEMKDAHDQHMRDHHAALIMKSSQRAPQLASGPPANPMQMQQQPQGGPQ